MRELTFIVDDPEDGLLLVAPADDIWAIQSAASWWVQCGLLSVDRQPT